ncbi:LLM class flavin-dependent oxidoreductase [Nocardia terpenica]|uniref:LLM class flavin-dependent oxidoreductase n=1 Tax=Nocardia terpenica TaxID=455432 RepID=A0A291RRN0_9NOCA|nr:LLM class flavin-dependent oxidoreductase [Nocardia terpenica]ATL69950.1 LLM class flavin-dependent oxidoreductase [Nocardia terpenica]
MISVPISVLNLVPVQKGTAVRDALEACVVVAGHIEQLGYRRLWFAEHHSRMADACCSPPILVGQIAAETSTLRVGSGGVMVPNHVPLTVAEQFATLDAFHPGRIDLGMGRGPGTVNDDVARALRRGAEPIADEEYQRDVRAVLSLFDPDTAPSPLPNYHPALQPWLLSSSAAGGQLAGELGLPIAIAHHIRPHNTEAALAAYRASFRPSRWLTEPYVLLCVLTVCADTDDRAHYVAGPNEVVRANLAERKLIELLAPDEAAAYVYTAAQMRTVHQLRETQAQGSPDTVARRLTDLVRATGADELMLYTPIYDLSDQLRSYELVAAHFSPNDRCSPTGP